MPDHSTNSYIGQGRVFAEWVWYEGADKLRKGEGLCYNSDYGTASNSNGERLNRAERPKPGNNLMFAGVAAHDYSAKSGGQFVEIYNPGSVCPVAIGQDVTIDTGLITAQAGSNGEAGRFAFEGLPGRGSAVPLQTVSDAIKERDIATNSQGALSTDGVTLTVTDSSDFEVGGTVVIVGGEDEGGTGNSEHVVPGKYGIAAINSDTEIELAESAVSGTPGSALNASYYVYNVNALALCKLLDGAESGLVEVVNPSDDGGSSDLSFMQGGKTYIHAVDCSSNSQGELADGEFFGERKAFEALEAISTNSVVVGFATNGKQLATGSSSTSLLTLASATFSSSADQFSAEWRDYWQEIGRNGASISST